MKGYIHSLQSLGTVDGPGVRAVIFSTGCPLRCKYCHNPDTWLLHDGKETESEELAERIFRLYPYIKDGGVTFSGGEPCVQAEFFARLAEILKQRGLHIALDTSGAILNSSVMELLRLCDLVLLDIKAVTEEGYRELTGGSLADTLRFLDTLEDMGKAVWIRNVVVPGINDSEENALALKALLAKYSCIEKIELLPFRKLCLEKYRSLDIPFPLESTPEMNAKDIIRLEALLK
ncbi:MAG: pyruvate formate lyase-activating protein [Clostridia bacterium]|nr:pyruvate formate lyase-activating protein [Clostridia bacterium]